MAKGSSDRPDKGGKSGFGRSEKRQPDGHDCVKNLVVVKGVPKCSVCGRPL